MPSPTMPPKDASRFALSVAEASALIPSREEELVAIPQFISTLAPGLIVMPVSSPDPMAKAQNSPVSTTVAVAFALMTGGCGRNIEEKKSLAALVTRTCTAKGSFS